jgi:hypothetical protein
MPINTELDCKASQILKRKAPNRRLLTDVFYSALRASLGAAKPGRYASLGYRGRVWPGSGVDFAIRIAGAALCPPC